MNIWDRIRNLMGRKPPSIDPGRELKPNRNPGSDFPSSSAPTTPPAMLNTLSISTDLTKVYLINDNKVHDFDLTSEEGITIGLLGGQLSIVTTKEVTSPTLSDQSEVPNEGSNRTGVSRPRVIEIDLNGKSAFNLQYNPAINAIGVIGATDLISTIPGPDAPPEPSGNCALHLFDLGRNLVRMRRSKNRLTVWQVPK